MSDFGVKVGEVLAGKYQVERVLGQGAMGVVVAARHLQLACLVALKFMLPQTGADRTALDRFLREAQAAGRLRGENIARIMDFGTLDTGCPYIVMEFLEGIDLDSLVKRRGRIPVEEAVEYVLQACVALREAHQAGIVHRDIKPQNLFLTRRPDGTPLVKVLDFGISKISGNDPASMSMTSSQMTMGSPLYMSYEQIKSAKQVDTRSDIYSLGVVLYELVSGAHPYEAESLPELFGRVMSSEPTRLRHHVPELSAEFEAVVMRAIHRDREQRVQSVGDLAELLEPFRAPPLQTHSAQTAGPFVHSNAAIAPQQPVPAEVIAGQSVARATESHAGVPVFDATAPPTTRTATLRRTDGARRRWPTWAWVVAVVVALPAVGLGVVALVFRGQLAGRGTAGVIAEQPVVAPTRVPSVAPTREPPTSTAQPAPSASAPAIEVTPLPAESASSMPQASTPPRPRRSRPVAKAVGTGTPAPKTAQPAAKATAAAAAPKPASSRPADPFATPD